MSHTLVLYKEKLTVKVIYREPRVKGIIYYKGRERKKCNLTYTNDFIFGTICATILE